MGAGCGCGADFLDDAEAHDGVAMGGGDDVGGCGAGGDWGAGGVADDLSTRAAECG